MNLARQGGDPNSSLLFVNFNQDNTSLAVGTKAGYKLFSLSSVDKLESIYDNDVDDICVVERLFSSSLVAIVSLSSPRKLKVCHFKKGTEICNYSYSNTILGVRLNRLRLVVCLEESLYIHNIRDMKVLHTIRDTPPNPQGLCALSINNDNCFLAYPGSNSIGEVQIFDAVNLRAVTMIPAHDNPLAAMAFNGAGTRIATASEKGTVIRVFSVPEGQKLFEFRRGVKRCATIYSLAFSPDSMLLCCSSNTETVHIFKLETVKERPNEEPQGWMGYVGNALKSSANYLPSQVTEMFNQGRDFAVARLPFSGLRTVCSLSVIQKLPRLMVASQDGYLYMYNLDPVEGGECTLLKQHRLDGRQDSVSLAEPPSSAVVEAGAGGVSPPSTGTPTFGSPARRLNDGPSVEGATGHVTGKPLASNSSCPGKTNSYARVASRVKRGASPKSEEARCTIEDAMQCTEDPSALRDLDSGEMGGDAVTGTLGNLQLNDETEFPPILQKTD